MVIEAAFLTNIRVENKTAVSTKEENMYVPDHFEVIPYHILIPDKWKYFLKKALYIPASSKTIFFPSIMQYTLIF